MTREEKICQLCIAQGLSLAVAESCTGGLLCQRLTQVSGSSQYLLAGLVPYSNTAKTKLLGIPLDLLAKSGAVSEPVAELLAQNVRAAFDATFGVGITGIAGPGGGSAAKPVGLVYIAVATEQETLCLKCQFAGTRQEIRRQAATQAMTLLLEFLE